MRLGTNLLIFICLVIVFLSGLGAGSYLVMANLRGFLLLDHAASCAILSVDILVLGDRENQRNERYES